jgi:glycine cleavage system H protein
MSMLKFADSHEYLLVDPTTESMARVGISQFAADQLGDVVYVELPDVGKVFEKGDVFGSIESVKAASDLYMPVAGRVVAINEKLSEAPQLVNDDCYDDGWLIEVELVEPTDANTLMSDADYQKHLSENQ